MTDDKRVVRATPQCCRDTLERFYDCLEELRSCGIKIGTAPSVEHDVEFTIEIDGCGVYNRAETLELAVRAAVHNLDERNES